MSNNPEKREYETSGSSTNQQSTKTKGIVIVLGIILVLAFFMPWLKIDFFASISLSGWDMVFGDAGKIIENELKYIALLIPVSGILIIMGAGFNNERYILPKEILFLAPFLSIYMISFIILLIFGNGGPLQNSDLTRFFGMGVWLTFISSLILLFFIVGGQTITTHEVNNTAAENKVNELFEIKDQNKIIPASESSSAVTPPASVIPDGKDSINKLRQLKQLLDDGILTREEFDEQKQKILKS